MCWVYTVGLLMSCDDCFALVGFFLSAELDTWILCRVQGWAHPFLIVEQLGCRFVAIYAAVLQTDE